MTPISTILKPTGVPVTHLTYSGTATTYITHQEYNSNGAAFAENKEIATNHYLQVDIWTNDTFEALAKKVLSLMTAAGYYRTYETEIYESDTKTKHKVIRFQIAESSQF